MEELQKLIKILDQNDFVWTDNIDEPAKDQNLVNKLYELIKEETIANEDELIDKLYGKQEKKGAYKMLKSRLKQRLYKHLLLIDTKDKTKISGKSVAKINANLLMNQAVVLEANSSPDLAIKLLLKALTLSRQFENTGDTIRALEQLRWNYSVYKFDVKLFNKVNDQLERYYKLNEVERRATSLYQRYMLLIRMDVRTRNKNLAALEQASKELFVLWEKTGSSNIYRYYNNLYTSFLENSGKFAHLADLMTEMIGLIKARKLNNGFFDVMKSRYLLVYAYLKSQQYEAGLLEAEALKKQIPNTSSNWFAHMENYFLLTVHAGNYKKAKQIIEEVFTNKAFSNNTQFAQERWFLFHELYVLITGDRTSYKTNRELKYVSQDKNGYNVWFLIQRFLKSLKTKDEEQIIWHTERLRKYQIKYLGAGSDKRTEMFFKLLLIAGQNHNQPSLIKRKGRYLYSRLSQTPVAGDAYAETEIVPYEQLWKFVLQQLDPRPETH